MTLIEGGGLNCSIEKDSQQTLQEVGKIEYTSPRYFKGGIKSKGKTQVRGGRVKQGTEGGVSSNSVEN